MSGDTLGISETELYDKLQKYIIPVEKLDVNGYPCPDPDYPGRSLAPLTRGKQRQQLNTQLCSSYQCKRCTKIYQVDSDGASSESSGMCTYHPGVLWISYGDRYSCCKGSSRSGGCTSNRYHVNRGELVLKNFEGFVETQPKPEREPNKHGIFALKCELCYTVYGLELTRVIVVNHKHDVVYETLVKPSNRILDYNTEFSGIKESDLDGVQTSVVDVQRDLLEIFSSKSILIGHSLDYDLMSLKIFHGRLVDTAQLFPHRRGLPYKKSLKNLMKEKLGVEVKEDARYNIEAFSNAALRLVLWKVGRNG